MGPRRTDLRSKMGLSSLGGGDVQDSLLCPTGHRPFGAAAQKGVGKKKFFLKLTRPDIRPNRSRWRVGKGSGQGQGQGGSGKGQQCSEITLSIDFASSQTSRYQPSYMSSYLRTYPLVESLSQTRKRRETYSRSKKRKK